MEITNFSTRYPKLLQMQLQGGIATFVNQVNVAVLLLLLLLILLLFLFLSLVLFFLFDYLPSFGISTGAICHSRVFPGRNPGTWTNMPLPQAKSMLQRIFHHKLKVCFKDFTKRSVETLYTEDHCLVGDVVVPGVQSPFFASTSLLVLFRCWEVLDKNETLIGEEMYDYQKELEHDFKQLQRQFQPMVGTHRKASHHRKARWVYNESVTHQPMLIELSLTLRERSLLVTYFIASYLCFRMQRGCWCPALV